MSRWHDELPDLSKVKDRGSKKWAMAMMLPEHTAMIRKMIEEDNKVKKPILDEFDFQLIQEELFRGYQSETDVRIETWHDGVITEWTGRITDIYIQSKEVVLDDGEQAHKLKLLDMVSAQTIY